MGWPSTDASNQRQFQVTRASFDGALPLQLLFLTVFRRTHAARLLHVCTPVITFQRPRGHDACSHSSPARATHALLRGTRTVHPDGSVIGTRVAVVTDRHACSDYTAEPPFHRTDFPMVCPKSAPFSGDASPGDSKRRPAGTQASFDGPLQASFWAMPGWIPAPPSDPRRHSSRSATTPDCDRPACAPRRRTDVTTAVRGPRPSEEEPDFSGRSSLPPAVQGGSCFPHLATLLPPPRHLDKPNLLPCYFHQSTLRRSPAPPVAPSSPSLRTPIPPHFAPPSSPCLQLPHPRPTQVRPALQCGR